MNAAATYKQYHKETKALRTETTINDTTDFTDFRIGKRLHNLPALREIGFSANRRLLRVQTISHDPITGTDTLRTVTAPIVTDTGTRVPGLRLGEQRSHALLTALPLFTLQPNGFTNPQLRALLTELRGVETAAVTPGQVTYDLRRPRTHGLIARLPHTHRYTLTDRGLATAMFLSAVHDRLLPSSVAARYAESFWQMGSGGAKPRSWTTSKDPYFVPKGHTSSVSIRSHRRAPRSSAPTS